MSDYETILQEIFLRFPSVQNVPFNQAYKPGLEGMLAFDQALGCPSKALKCIHIAGTNGKGSVANMLASALFACGYRTGLYTSPHIEDFRERARINGEMIPKEYVFGFLKQWKPYFEEHSLSFFEITTGLALKWFADEAVDVAVIEVGLGGRLDSTNIITPLLSVVTTIGLDHCSLLGNSLAEIAAEKAGIFKPGVPALVGEATPETLPVFEAHAQGPLFIADKNHLPSRTKSFSPEKRSKNFCPTPEIDVFCLLQRMDLQAAVQRKNLKTVLSAVELLKNDFPKLEETEKVEYGIANTAKLMHFHGRWERLREKPLVIADIGHNAQALESNFRQLEASCSEPPVIVYGIMADKDLDAIIPLMPRRASWIFTTPSTKRALPAAEIAKRAGMPDVRVIDKVADAVKEALRLAGETRTIYIGGSTFVVSEAEGTIIEEK